MIMARVRHPFWQYFIDVWQGISTTYKGMRLTLSYFFKPKVTMEYPEVRPVLPSTHRGLHIFHEEKCTACGQCVKICPVDCIKLDAIGKAKNAMILQYEIDYQKCLFCDLCCEVCPTECIVMGPEFDLSALERRASEVELASKKTETDIAAHKEMLEKKELEKKAKAEAARKAKAEADKAKE